MLKYKIISGIAVLVLITGLGIRIHYLENSYDALESDYKLCSIEKSSLESKVINQNKEIMKLKNIDNTVNINKYDKDLSKVRQNKLKDSKKSNESMLTLVDNELKQFSNEL